MQYTLKNEYLTVIFESLGGALHSIKNQEGLEYLWQGDPGYWSGQAPVLFPICGSIRDDKAELEDGRIIQMPRHGLVRKREFFCTKQTEDSVLFEFKSDDAMLCQYPFPFCLRICYTLKEHKITTKYMVENLGDEDMPFFIGGHPGFRWPLYENEQSTDYELIFEKEENCDVPFPITETGLIDMKHRMPFLNHQKKLQLTHQFFEKDAVIFDQLKSRSVTYQSSSHGKGVKIDFKDFPYFIIWSTQNEGPFLAMEPWIGLSTCNDENDQFEKKWNVQKAKSGQRKEYSFDISILW